MTLRVSITATGGSIRFNNPSLHHQQVLQGGVPHDRCDGGAAKQASPRCAYSELRNSSSWLRWDGASRWYRSREVEASPACTRIASSTVLARPSCR